MIQSPNFVHLSNVAVLKSAFTVEALKLFLVLFLIDANFFFSLNMAKSSTCFTVLILFAMSLSLFCMLAEYMICHSFNCLCQKEDFQLRCFVCSVIVLD